MLITETANPLESSFTLSECRRLHLYNRGDKIPLAPKGLWQIYRGWVQMSTTHLNGEESVLGWAQPGTFFGLWLTSLEVYDARALSDVYLQWFFMEEVLNSPPLVQNLAQQFARRLRQTETLLAIAGQKRVEERLYLLLKLLKTEMGQCTQGGTRLAIRLTHQYLADAINSTRVTVTRLMGKLQREGYFKIDGDRHLILNPAQFP